MEQSHLTFAAQFPVAFADCDLVGIVYYPRFLHYCHLAMEALVDQCSGTTYAAMVTHERLGLATVKVTAEYLAPLVYGDSFQAEINVPRIGRSSVDLSYVLRRVRDDVISFRTVNTHVCLDFATLRAKPLPDKYRDALARYMPPESAA